MAYISLDINYIMDTEPETLMISFNSILQKTHLYSREIFLAAAPDQRVCLMVWLALRFHLIDKHRSYGLFKGNTQQTDLFYLHPDQTWRFIATEYPQQKIDHSQIVVYNDLIIADDVFSSLSIIY